MTNISYLSSVGEVAVGTSVGASDVIVYSDFTSGMVYVPAGSSLTTLTWHACPTRDGTYAAAEDAASSAVTQTVAGGQAHPIPAALQGAGFIKITGNAAGTVAITLKTS